MPLQREGIAMNIDKPTGMDRIESMVRGMLAFVLLVAVAWAYAQGGGAPAF